MKAGLPLQRPSIQSTLADWWCRTRSLVPAKERKAFDTLVVLICWSLRKQRNAGVFNNVEEQRSVVELTETVMDTFREWIRVRSRRGVGAQIERE